MEIQIPRAIMARVPERTRIMRLVIAGVALIGLVLALVLGIVFFISLSIKGQTFLAWTVILWFTMLWIALGMSLAITFQPKRNGTAVVEILTAIVWLTALVFAFAGSGFITFIWGKCILNAGSLDDAEAVICSSSQEWLLWLLLVFGFAMLILTAVGFAVHFYDYFAPRIASIQAVVKIPGLIGKNGDEPVAPGTPTREAPTIPPTTTTTEEAEPQYNRSGLVRIAIAIVGLLGIMWALAVTLVFLITVGIKNATYVTWLFFPLYIPFWVAVGISTTMIFLAVKGTKSFLEVIAIVAWIIAFAFAIVAVAFYSIVWSKCIFNKGSFTAGEQAICDHERWLIWLLWFFSLAIVIHTLAGVVIHVWDYLSRARPTIARLLQMARSGSTSSYETVNSRIYSGNTTRPNRTQRPFISPPPLSSGNKRYKQ